MPRSRCEICGRPATVHETVRRGDHVATTHRCRAHGEPTWLAAIERALVGQPRPHDPHPPNRIRRAFRGDAPPGPPPRPGL